MIKFITLIIFVGFGSIAFAYKDGTYSCKNNYDGLPNNIYKIQTLPIAGLKGAGIPYIEVTRFSREKDGDTQSAIIESHVKGTATLISNNRGIDALQLMAMTFEFDNDQFINCEK